MTHRSDDEKGAGGGKAEKESPPKASPDPPPPEQSPFERFEEFARKVVSVPKSEVDARDEAYRKRHGMKAPA